MHQLFNPVAPYQYLLPILPCISLWKISQIRTYLCVVAGPEFVSISATFMRSSTIHPAGPQNRFSQNRKLGHHCWRREVWTQLAHQLSKNRCDSSATYRLCRLQHCRRYCHGNYLVCRFELDASCFLLRRCASDGVSRFPHLNLQESVDLMCENNSFTSCLIVHRRHIVVPRFVDCYDNVTDRHPRIRETTTHVITRTVVVSLCACLTQYK